MVTCTINLPRSCSITNCTMLFAGANCALETINFFLFMEQTSLCRENARVPPSYYHTHTCQAPRQFPSCRHRVATPHKCTRCRKTHTASGVQKSQTVLV